MTISLLPVSMIAMRPCFFKPRYCMPTSIPTAFIPCEYVLLQIETVVSYGNLWYTESRVIALGAVPCAYVLCAHRNAIVSSAVKNMLRCLLIISPLFPYLNNIGNFFLNGASNGDFEWKNRLKTVTIRHNGIFPCFLGGFLSTLFSSIFRARMSAGRVWAGSITSSM